MKWFWSFIAVLGITPLGAVAADAQESDKMRIQPQTSAATSPECDDKNSDDWDEINDNSEIIYKNRIPDEEKDEISKHDDASNPLRIDALSDADTVESLNTAVVQANDETIIALPTVDVVGSVPNDEFRLDVENVGVLRMNEIHFEEYMPTETLDRILSRINGARVRNNGGALHAQTLSLRGAGAQDVGVNYRGVVVNSLSDAIADLSFFVPDLLGTARVYGTGSTSSFGAVSGLVEFTGNDADTPVQARFYGSTLGDHSLFARGARNFGRHRMALSSFGDRSEGKFRYTDDQGSSQIRNHNAAARIGAEMSYDGSFDFFKLSAFTFFSRIDRQEAGVSEYPDAYRRATDAQLLSLNRISAETLPVPMGKSFATFAIALAQRTAQKSYQNPTMLMGYRPIDTRHFENQTQVLATGEWNYDDISTTRIALRYAYQRVSTHYASGVNSIDQIHDRNIASASFAENLHLIHDSLQIIASGSVDRQIQKRWTGSASLAVLYQTPFQLQLGASSAFAQRLPSFDELYYRTEFIRGNPDLKPQKSIVNEVTAAYRYGDSLDLNITGFYNFHRDLIRYVPESPTLTRVKNFTDAVSRGVEISAKYQFHDSVGIRLDYAWTNAQTKYKTPLPQVSEHRVSGQLYYRKKPFSFAFLAQYESPVAQNMAATSYRPARTDLSVEASIALPPGMTIAIAVYNLLDDRRRQDVLQHPLPGRYGAISLRIATFE